MEKDIGESLTKLDFLIHELEQDCEWPKINCLMQRLVDAKSSFLEVYPDEDI